MFASGGAASLLAAPLMAYRPARSLSSRGGVAIADLKTWKVVTRINTDDGDPIFVPFSDAGKFAYVSNGHESTVATIDMTKPQPPDWEVASLSNAGTIGPYGSRSTGTRRRS